VFDADLCGQATHEETRKLRSEWVVSVSGVVAARAEGMTNPKLATGEIEVRVKTMEVLSRARTRRSSLTRPRA
jgi:aspartyl-tRNA synthetase